MLEVVAGVADHHEIGRGHDTAQAQSELGAADAAGQGDDQTLVGLSLGSGAAHRNKSSSAARISAAAGASGTSQVSPRTRMTGRASSDCPINSEAALAISSANPVCVA